MKPWYSYVFVAAAAMTLQAEAQLAPSEMVKIAAGPFMMGSDDGPQDERPAHQVTLAAFAIDRFPVTNAQFAEFLNAVGYTNAKGKRLFDQDDPDARIHQASGGWIGAHNIGFRCAK